MSKNIKFCPKLVGTKEYEPLLIGNGKVTVPTIEACLREKCVAYKDGKCLEYENNVEIEVKEND